MTPQGKSERGALVKLPGRSVPSHGLPWGSGEELQTACVSARGLVSGWAGGPGLEAGVLGLLSRVEGALQTL